MNAYGPPDISRIKEELARAGADEGFVKINGEERRRVGSEIGAIWIVQALHGVGRTKTPARATKGFGKVEEKLRAALGEFNKLPDFDKERLADDLGGGIRKVSSLTKFLLENNGKIQKERAHIKLVDALERYFESEQLPIAISEGSPFVTVFALCSGMENDSAETTLTRLRQQARPNKEQTGRN